MSGLIINTSSHTNPASFVLDAAPSVDADTEGSEAIADPHAVPQTPGADERDAVADGPDAASPASPPRLTFGPAAPVKIAGRAVTATRCDVEGGPLRRYLASADEGCTLRIDTSFADAGTLTVSSEGSGQFAALSVDKGGAVYVHVAGDNSIRIDGDTPSEACPLDHKLRASRQSDAPGLWAGPPKPERVTMPECVRTPVEPAGWGTTVFTGVLPLGDGFLAQASGMWWVHGPSGNKRFVLGNLPPPSASMIDAVERCGRRICGLVHNGIVVWGSGGKY